MKRLDRGTDYWYVIDININGIPTYEADGDMECLSPRNDTHYKTGNYFHTEEEAQAIADKLNAATKPIWEELKPKQLKPERWNPKKGKAYYYAKFLPDKGEFEPSRMTYLDDPFDNGCIQHGNCFATEDEAQDLCDKWNLAIGNL